ncbi:MAG: hypothetical protein M3Q40_03310, partial [Pseudomonadota bacterium]|nr:hypothetical protein [Pseudomonadota bacterium]
MSRKTQRWPGVMAGALLPAMLGACAAPAQTRPSVAPERPPALPEPGRPIARPARVTVVPPTVPQGGLVIGRTAPDAVVEHEGRTLHVTPYGTFVFGVARDARGPAVVRIDHPGAGGQTYRIQVLLRDWPVERVDGVPPATVSP